jgi:hypothetical protein
MFSVPLDQQLRRRLIDIPEISGSGFSTREGLTGSGVTILKGRTYFGSWRLTAGKLMWVSSTMGEGNVLATSVDDAIRHTMLMILASLKEAVHAAKLDHAKPERATGF